MVVPAVGKPLMVTHGTGVFVYAAEVPVNKVVGFCFILSKLDK